MEHVKERHEAWVSTPKITCLVVTDENSVIVETCPVLRWSLGHRFRDLTRWLSKQGEVKIEPLNPRRANPKSRIKFSTNTRRNKTNVERS